MGRQRVKLPLTKRFHGAAGSACARQHTYRHTHNHKPQCTRGEQSFSLPAELTSGRRSYISQNIHIRKVDDSALARQRAPPRHAKALHEQSASMEQRARKEEVMGTLHFWTPTTRSFWNLSRRNKRWQCQCSTKMWKPRNMRLWQLTLQESMRRVA